MLGMFLVVTEYCHAGLADVSQFLVTLLCPSKHVSVKQKFEPKLLLKAITLLLNINLLLNIAVYVSITIK